VLVPWCDVVKVLVNTCLACRSQTSDYNYILLWWNPKTPKWEKMARNYNILDIFRVVCETATRLYKYIVRVFPREDPGGARTRRAPPPPLKLEKRWFFGVKSWFFTRNTPKIFAPPSAIGKNMIFWRKIVIFHTKYPKNFRASLCNWKKYDFFVVKSWFFTRNTPKKI
jgi:hypothetical protein